MCAADGQRTIISGLLADQPALHGLLTKYGAGVCLIGPCANWP